MAEHRVDILMHEPVGEIHPALHGHFAEHLGGCVDGGIWVGEECKSIEHIGGIRRDVVAALKRISPPVLRWPGGCFADDYHWRDGIGARGNRPRTVNIHWGQAIEDNQFGTHEFIQFCRLIGAEPYLAGNMGSGSPREMRDWIEYCNFTGDSTLSRERGANGSSAPFDVRLWGVGNENWGCGGNMCPEDYAVQYKQFSSYCRDFGASALQLIACGPNSGEKDFHVDWTRRFFKRIKGYPRVHAFAAHYYCGTAGTATQYTADQWYELLASAARIEQVILTHRAAMDEFEVGKKCELILDEWGTWHPPTPGAGLLWQQNTMRDALVAATTLDTFNRHADKITMANIAQLANVLQALILTDGPRMLLTPTYHVFDLYQSHKGAQSVRLEIDSNCAADFLAKDQRQSMPTISGSASMHGKNLTISLVNAHASEPAEITLNVRLRDAKTRTLAHDEITAHNTFDQPARVSPRDGLMNGSIVALPPASVTVVRATLQ
ncbi:alpha-L-arabinofuranosidase C-terminal domain-containing protein [soil metagenome]